MTNEMKLLTALCDALGFDVEENKDYKSHEIPEKEGHHQIRYPFHQDCSKWELETGSDNEFKRGEKYSYFIKLKEPIIDYKLTKKADGKKWDEALAGGALK